MNWRNIIDVYAKELRDTLRDRRTIIWSIVFPVLFIPGLMFGMIGISAKVMKKASGESAPVVLIGEQNAPELARRIRGIERFAFEEAPEDLDAAVGSKQIRAAVEIPPEFETALANGEQPALLIRFHSGEFKSESAVSDIRRVATDYRQELVEAKLVDFGLGAKDLEPFILKPQNVASQEQVIARSAGGIVPYVIILMCLVGAMFPAIDLTAGEKERGTMETIVASSVGRTELVLGKFLTVMTTSLSTCVLSLASLAVTATVIVPRLIGAEASGDMKEFVAMARSVDPMGILGLLLLILPLTMLFSAVLMSVALFARSYREAQQYIGPLPAVVILPAMIGLLPGTELSFKTAMIPITGTSLAGKELLAGAFDWSILTVIFASSCVYALIALTITVRQFRREEVLFRA